MSRQIVLALFIAPALLALLPALASAQAWQEYRRDDLGFKIEMPGKPEIESTEDKSADRTVQSTKADVTYGDAMFSVSVDQTYVKGASIRPDDEYLNRSRRGMEKALGLKATSEKQFTTNGFPGHEFMFDVKGYYHLIRMIVLENRVITVSVNGNRSLETDPVVRRFLDSFAVLVTR